MDLDEEIRKNLLLDVAKWMPETDAPYGVLVSGDIAHGGQQAQYETAREWLRRLTDTLGCEPSHVWCVPGNHDIDWEVVAEDEILRMLHDTFRPDPPLSDHEVNAKVRSACEGKGISKHLLAPLEAYNAFVAGYGGVCGTSVSDLTWHENIPLNDGSMLRLWGINSVLVSNRNDNDGLNRLVVSAHQIPDSEPGVALLTLCHHPPEWIRDSDQLTARLNDRASIQLFGHRHRHRTEQKEQSLILHAGALHPERGHEHWDPRYNVIQITVDGEGDERFLVTEVRAREWKHGEGKFGPVTFGESFTKRNRLRLDPWTRPEPEEPIPVSDVHPVASPAEAEAPPTEDEAPPIEGEAPLTESEDAMDSMRNLVYDFYDLPYSRRYKVIIEMKLLYDEDKGVSERELVRRVVERIRHQNRQPDFEAAIRAAA